MTLARGEGALEELCEKRVLGAVLWPWGNRKGPRAAAGGLLECLVFCLDLTVWGFLFCLGLTGSIVWV